MLWHAVASCRVHPFVNCEPAGLSGLGRVGIDADHDSGSGFLEDDLRQQTVTASQIQAAAGGQAARDQLIDFDRSP
jgi:hypothetical protein